MFRYPSCHRICLPACWGFLGLVFLGTGVARAETIHVYVGGSIQAAIAAAVAGDDILVHPGTYNEAINLLGKAISVHSSDGPGVTIINASGQGASVVTCMTGEGPETVIEGFTLTGGTGYETDGFGRGGGLYASSASPTITNCAFSGNSAYQGGGAYTISCDSAITDCTFTGNTVASYGGGLYCHAGTVVLTRATLSGNYATYNGGGIYVYGGSPEINDSTFSGNTASAKGGGMDIRFGSATVTGCDFFNNTAVDEGGGIWNADSATEITDCLFSGNRATVGGSKGGGVYNNLNDAVFSGCTFASNGAQDGDGMYLIGGSPTVTDCSFSGALTIGSGGGVYNESTGATFKRCAFTNNTQNHGAAVYNYFGRPIFIDCEFVGNHANGYGGAVYSHNCTAMIVNCLFRGNTALAWGGGIYNFSRSRATIINSTFYGNTSTEGGAMKNYSNSNVNVRNTIMWANSPDQMVDSFSTSSVTYCDIQGGFAGTGNISAYPQFINPGAGDLRLGAGSACTDAGDNTVVPGDITTDLDGNPRFADDPDVGDTGNGDAPIVDIGAYEFGSECQADFNGDGAVDTLDFLAYLNAFAAGDSRADFNGDGSVDTLDFLAYLNAFAAGC